MELAVLLLLPLLVGAAYVLGQYNGLVALRNHIREAWSNVDTELNRRHDLIPNLVAVLRGFAAHEQAVLERVAALRQAAREARGVGDRGERERELASGLDRLLAVAEAYPALQADAHFLELQRELVRTEDRIQAARRFYNGNVRDYRNKCEAFPSNWVASIFGFLPEEFLSADPGVRTVPRV